MHKDSLLGLWNFGFVSQGSALRTAYTFTVAPASAQLSYLFFFLTIEKTYTSIL